MPVSAELRTHYAAQRLATSRDRYGRPRRTPVPAMRALQDARAAIRHGHAPAALGTADPLGHGSVIRTRKPDGTRVTYAIAHVPDSDMGAPWEEHDGHGIIREVAPSRFGASGTTDKRPGERLFGSDERHGRLYAYDIAATMVRARQDGWGLSPDAMADLTRKLGRVPTARQIAAAAVEADFERMRAWTRDGWEWIGVCLVEMPRDRTSDDYVTGDFVADAVTSGHGPYNVRASLWGIESDSGADYLDEVARERVSEAR